MERIGFLINKLKEQYEKADSKENMLVTLQMLYRELLPKMDMNPAVGSVSVVVPGQMDQTYLEKNIGEKFSLDLAANKSGKQVFELSVEPTENAVTVEKQPVPEIKPAEIQPVPEVKIPKNPFVVSTPKVEPPIQKEPVAPKVEPIVVKSEPVLPPQPQKEEKKAEEQPEINARFMPPQPKPVVVPAPPMAIPPPQKTAPVTPPKEVHESIQIEKQTSLNDKVEKRQPELFHTLKAEPLKDLKRAISINERFQYINHLFLKDETMYERSLKTINSFNVLSEASFWIRKELATKLGWADDDELVQQFMQLVERRFS